MRRGICQPCRKTFTILPDWLVPSGHYSLACRQLACERICGGDSVEQAAPDCQDPSRSPDPSTLRRWVHRRLLSVWCWARAAAPGEQFLQSPTILAWDLACLCHILVGLASPLGPFRRFNLAHPKLLILKRGCFGLTFI